MAIMRKPHEGRGAEALKELAAKQGAGAWLDDPGDLLSSLRASAAKPALLVVASSAQLVERAIKEAAPHSSAGRLEVARAVRAAVRPRLTHLPKPDEGEGDEVGAKESEADDEEEEEGDSSDGKLEEPREAAEEGSDNEEKVEEEPEGASAKKKSKSHPSEKVRAKNVIAEARQRQQERLQ